MALDHLVRDLVEPRLEGDARAEHARRLAQWQERLAQREQHKARHAAMMAANARARQATRDASVAAGGGALPLPLVPVAPQPQPQPAAAAPSPAAAVPTGRGDAQPAPPPAVGVAVVDVHQALGVEMVVHVEVQRLPPGSGNGGGGGSELRFVDARPAAPAGAPFMTLPRSVARNLARSAMQRLLPDIARYTVVHGPHVFTLVAPPQIAAILRARAEVRGGGAASRAGTVELTLARHAPRTATTTTTTTKWRRRGAKTRVAKRTRLWHSQIENP